MQSNGRYCEKMLGLTQTLSLFHGLAGLSVGWSWGARHGAIAGFGMFVGGTIVGLVTGFLVGYMPTQVSLATAKISGKHRLVAAVVAIFGYLVWLGLGIAFWWVCLNLQQSAEMRSAII